MGCALGVGAAVVAVVLIGLYMLHSIQGGTNSSLIPGMGEKTYTRADPPVTVPVTKISQVFVCNKSGNVNLTVDPDAKSVQIAVNRSVKAQSQEAAEQEYQRIKVQAQTMSLLDIASACQSPLAVPTAGATTPTGAGTPTAPGTADATLSCLVVNVAFPSDDELNTSPVDLTISLPQSALPAISATQPIDMLVSVEASRQGNIGIGKGLSGVFKLKGSFQGDITIDGTMAPDSYVSTPEGKIIFRGDLAIPTSTPPNGQTYNFNLIGTQIDATLPTNRNLTLHVATPGKIVDGKFPLQTDAFTTDNANKDHPIAHYDGPLNPDAPPPPSADYQVKPEEIQLTLRASRGDVTLRQK
jgi:hypothetical protein